MFLLHSLRSDQNGFAPPIPLGISAWALTLRTLNRAPHDFNLTRTQAPGRYVSVALSPFKRGFRALQDALRLPSAAVSGVHDDLIHQKIDILNWVFGLSSPHLLCSR